MKRQQETVGSIYLSNYKKSYALASRNLCFLSAKPMLFES